MKFITQLIKKLDKIIELLSEEKEHREKMEQERLREENEKQLREYALRHNKKYAPPPQMHNTNEWIGQPVTNAKDAIPYNLSETDKAILRMYYDKSDNREG